MEIVYEISEEKSAWRWLRSWHPLVTSGLDSKSRQPTAMEGVNRMESLIHPVCLHPTVTYQPLGCFHNAGCVVSLLFLLFLLLTSETTSTRNNSWTRNLSKPSNLSSLWKRRVHWNVCWIKHAIKRSCPTGAFVLMSSEWSVIYR